MLKATDGGRARQFTLVSVRWFLFAIGALCSCALIMCAVPSKRVCPPLTNETGVTLKSSIVQPQILLTSWRATYFQMVALEVLVQVGLLHWWVC